MMDETVCISHHKILYQLAQGLDGPHLFDDDYSNEDFDVFMILRRYLFSNAMNISIFIYLLFFLLKYFEIGVWVDFNPHVLSALQCEPLCLFIKNKKKIEENNPNFKYTLARE